MLANEAVKPERQMEIVDLGGLRLLLPLTQSPDLDIQRLAAHALANLSVHADNQVRGAGGSLLQMHACSPCFARPGGYGEGGWPRDADPSLGKSQ